jgi:hypothetical protein
MRSMLVTAVLLAFVSQASAQAAPPPPPKPQKSSAAQSSDFMDLRLYPLTVFLGGLSADLDFRLNDQWTLGPSLGYWRFNLDQTSGFTSSFTATVLRAGVRANWFKNGTFTSGLYLGPSIDYTMVKVSTSDASGTITATGNTLAVTGLVGYGWFWNSFNMMLGAGAALALGPTKIDVSNTNGSSSNSVSTQSGAGLALEYTIGWTF